MIAVCFVFISLFSIAFSLFTGNFTSLTTAIIDGCEKSITISLRLCGMACFWCGIMNVFLVSGLLGHLERFLSPLMKLIFPRAFTTGHGSAEITAAVSANLLGIGNAATPFALTAMNEMDKDENTEDMAVFTILGTCSVNVVPTTLITLRRAAGSAAPYSIILPIWICSLICAAVGIILGRIFTAAHWRRE